MFNLMCVRWEDERTPNKEKTRAQQQVVLEDMTWELAQRTPGVAKRAGTGS